MCAKNWVKCSICALVTGLIFLIAGCVLIPVFHTVIDNEIKEQIPLKDGSTTFNTWKEPDLPIFFQVYVFDLINPLEVVQQGAKPAVVQKGPYTYREHRKKHVDGIDHKEGTITYRETRTFHYDREKSDGRLETERFTTVNIPMVTIASLIRYEYSFIQELVELVLDWGDENNLFMELSVKELVWGYEDNLLKKVNGILVKHNLTGINDTFGLFASQNNSDDGVYSIYSGEQGVDKFGIIKEWNNQSMLKFWNTDYCNMVNGTDGTIFPPFVDTSDKLYLFSSDICRSIYMEYEGNTQTRGIDTYKFGVPPVVFQDYKHNPDNAGYCSPRGNCLPSGLLNCSVCREGAPVILSQPHFMAANQSVIDSITGLHPSKEEHQTVIHVEPMTGVAFNAQKKLQLNVFIQNVSHISDTLNIDHIYYPVMWLNESALLTEKMANDFKSQVLLPVHATQGVQYGLIVLGVVVALIAVSVLIRKKMSNKGEELEDVSTDVNNTGPHSDREGLVS